MSEQAVLREYLVSLGFKVDNAAQKKFQGNLLGLDKTATNLGKSVLGVAAAAQTMVGIFAVQMEKLYYSSKRTGSTVANIQALEFGAKNIGLSGETIRGALEGMARSLRGNPGLTALLNQIGVQVKGRDMSDVMTDMVTQLRKMPFFVAQQYASLFGMDADTLFMMQEGLEKLKEAQAIRKQMQKDSGVDSEKAAAAAVEYSNALRGVGERLGILRDILSLQMLPGFLAFTQALNDNLDSLNKWLGKFETLGQAAASFFKSDAERKVEEMMGRGVKPGSKDKPKNFFDWLTTPTTDYQKPIEFKNKDGSPMATTPIDTATMARSLIPDWTRRPEHRNSAHTGVPDATGAGGGRGFVNPGMPASAAQPPATSASELFARLERQYALPEGLLDRVWKQESGRGTNMNSPAGAKGHFQFMDPTAAQYGVTDPNDLTNSATGAAKMWSDRLKARNGDVRLAAADYNWGQGRVDRLGVDKAPKETRDYMDAIGGPVQQTNTITIQGVRDPQQAAQLVGNELQTNNADLVRNMTPRIQ
jgi:hypothetical protein